MGNRRTSGTANSKPLRAAAYVRLSVMTEETTSLISQREEVIAYCQRQGWHLDPEVDLFEDAGYSGSKQKVKRPAFERLLASIDNYDRIVVWKLDRFTRRLQELATVLEELKRTGGALVSIKDGVDSSTLGGQVVASVLGTLAQAEATSTEMRVRQAQETMAKAGRWKGGNRPYGWTSGKHKDGVGTRLVLVENEAQVLRQAIAIVMKGVGVAAAARELNTKGYTSPKGNPWSPQALKQILRAPLLAGWHRVGGVTIRGEDGHPLVAHQALLTESEWYALQDRLKARTEVRPQGEGALLSGIIFCGICGGRMHGSNSTANPRANYRCRNRYALNKTDLCPGTSVRAVVVDELVGEAVVAVLKRRRNREKAATGLVQARVDRSERGLKLANEEALLIRHIELLRGERTEPQWAFDGGLEAWKADMAKLVNRLNDVRNRMLEANVVPPPAPGMESWLTAEDVEHMWRHRTDKQKRSLFHALVERIVILPPNPEWHHRAFDTSRVEVKWRGTRDRPAEGQA